MTPPSSACLFGIFPDLPPIVYGMTQPIAKPDLFKPDGVLMPCAICSLPFTITRIRYRCCSPECTHVLNRRRKNESSRRSHQKKKALARGDLIVG